MSKRSSRLLLKDILESIQKIQKYTKGLSFRKFLGNQKTSDAVVRNFEIIGEAAHQLPLFIKKLYKQIEWRKVVGLRNRIIHEYFGVDYEILWFIMNKELNELKAKIEKILQDFKSRK